MSRLQELLDMPIYGNAASDQPLFNLANEIIMDESETNDTRIRALQKIEYAMMGSEEELIDWDDVLIYIEFIDDSQ